MFGLSGLAEDTVSLLQQQLQDLQKQIQALVDQQAYAYQQYNYNHFGGQSPDQFSDYIGALQAKQASLQGQADQLTQKIANLNTTAAASATAAATAAANKPLTPAQVSQATNDAADTLERQLQVLQGPRYDFGVGSAKRNQFWRETTRPGLGLDIWGAIQTAVQKEGLNAVKGISIKDPALQGGTSVPSIVSSLSSMLPTIPVPAALRDLHVSAPNLSKLTSAVQAELKNQQRAAAPAPAGSAAAVSAPAASSSGGLLKTVFLVVSIAAGGYVVYRIARGRRRAA